MQNLVLTQLTTPELGQLFYDAIDRYFADKKFNPAQPDADEIGGIDLAVKITGKAKSTIYGLVHSRSIPHSKQGKKLYFSRKNLLEWIHSGERKTASEISTATEKYLGENRNEK